MPSSIRISHKWSDEDVAQLEFVVSDGQSTSVTSAYVGLDWAQEVANELKAFARQVHGGIYDLEAGTPGPEFADGAFLARLHWFTPARLLIATRQQSDFFEFKGNQVATEATLFLRTEPALLDRFIDELRALHNHQREDATLECVLLDA
jgi:hypothetical protein